MLKLLLTICLLSQIVKAQSFSSIPSWQEEFNYSGPPDSTIWSFDLGGEGWGNRELQNYTSRFENIKVDDGMLQITARKEASGKNEYSSARLVTKIKKISYTVELK